MSRRSLWCYQRGWQSHHLDQIGRVYSFRATIGMVGGSLGLLLVVPIFAHASVPLVIGGCAVSMLAVGIAGFVRFGFTDPSPPAFREMDAPSTLN